MLGYAMHKTFYLIGIDPGNNTGLALFEIYTDTFEIKNISTSVVVLNTLVHTEEELLMNRNIILGNLCVRLAETYDPNIMAMEAAFLNSRFPKAVMQLSQYTSTVEQAFYCYNKFIKLFKYPPKYVKKAIGAGGNADKDGMTVAVANISELSSKIDLSRVTEHEIDALAIGYITIQTIRLNPHILIGY